MDQPSDVGQSKRRYDDEQDRDGELPKAVRGVYINYMIHGSRRVSLQEITVVVDRPEGGEIHALCRSENDHSSI